MKPDNAPSIIKAATDNMSSRWPRRGTNNRLEPECWPVLHPTFQFPAGSTVFTIGSCFARNIETHLAELGFRVPTLEFLGPNPQQAHLLNRYTPPAIYQELIWTRAIMERDDTVRMDDIERFLVPGNGDKVIDLQIRSGNATYVTPEMALNRRRLLYQLSRHAFTAEVVVITLGLIECWWDELQQIYVEFA